MVIWHPLHEICKVLVISHWAALTLLAHPVGGLDATMLVMTMLLMIPMMMIVMLVMMMVLMMIQGVFLTGTPLKSSKYKKVNLG